MRRLSQIGALAPSRGVHRRAGTRDAAPRFAAVAALGYLREDFRGPPGVTTAPASAPPRDVWPRTLATMMSASLPPLAPWLVIGALTAGLAALVFALPPIAQPQAYHDFADRRACWGLPNCLDVASNAFFMAAAGWGLILLQRGRGRFVDGTERWPWVLFFAAVILIGLASAHYHLAPDNARLAWDRAAMALAFMAWLAALLGERLGLRAGRVLLLPLMAAGLGAVAYWHWSETQGAGDLRPWLLVQLLPIVLVPALLWRCPARYSRGRDMLIVIALYLVALLLDWSDRAVFALSGGLIGGHALKHLVAALAVALVARHLQQRRPI